MSETLTPITLNMTRGDYMPITFRVREPQATPSSPKTWVDLTNAKIVFTAKKKNVNGRSVHADPVRIRKTADDTSEIFIFDQTDPENIGFARIFLMTSDTQFMEPGDYEIDIRVTPSANKQRTVLKGQLILAGDVGSAEDVTTP